MNNAKEFMQMKKLIEDMPIDKFEQMLEKNGMDRILPSYKSSYVRCMKEKFGEHGWKYNLKPDVLKNQERYLDYSLSDQGAA